MKIDIICNDGSPLGVTPMDIFGDSGRIGIGGAEFNYISSDRGVRQDPIQKWQWATNVNDSSPNHPR